MPTVPDKTLADYPHVAAGLQYARDVVEGRIVAGKYTIAACQRQLDDLAAVESGDRPDLYFDLAKANRVCWFVEGLRHVKGIWAKRRLNIKLQPWQKFILTTAYGWMQDKPFRCLTCNADLEEPADECPECGEANSVAGGWLRRFTTVYEEIARKNAKTTIGAALMGYALTEEGEAGAEVYSVATGHDQARISFDIFRLMVKADEEFSGQYDIEARAHNVCSSDQMDQCSPLSSDTKGLDGKNPSFCLVDEYHAHLNDAVVAAMETGMGAREQPMLFIVTTAGANRAGPCYAKRAYAAKVLDGVVDDDSTFAIIYTLDEKDDPLEDPTCWIKANPNLGVSVYEDYLEKAVSEAREDPRKQTHVLTKNFNMWVTAEARLVNMVHWKACSEPRFDINDFKGEPCWVGVDLASSDDIAAVGMGWPVYKQVTAEVDGRTATMRVIDELYVSLRYYLPEDLVREHAAKTHAHYAGWAASGLLTLTPGDIIDHGQIQRDLLELPGRGFAVEEIAYDPWHGTQMMTSLGEAGATVVPVSATAKNYSEPTKLILALSRARKIHHNGDPILEWAASNVVGHEDNKGNIFPKKERRREKIDPFLALVLLVSRAMVATAKPQSQYNQGARLVTSAGREA